MVIDHQLPKLNAAATAYQSSVYQTQSKHQSLVYQA